MELRFILSLTPYIIPLESIFHMHLCARVDLKQWTCAKDVICKEAVQNIGNTVRIGRRATSENGTNSKRR